MPHSAAVPGTSSIWLPSLPERLQNGRTTCDAMMTHASATLCTPDINGREKGLPRVPFTLKYAWNRRNFIMVGHCTAREGAP